SALDHRLQPGAEVGVGRAPLVGEIDCDFLDRYGGAAAGLAETEDRARAIADDCGIDAAHRLRASDRNPNRLDAHSPDLLRIEPARDFPGGVDALAPEGLEAGEEKDGRHQLLRTGCSIGTSSRLPHSAHDPQ